MKAEIAQHAQIVLFNARRRIADKTHAPRDDIVKALLCRVVQRAVSIGVKRINGEVTPRRIALPIFGEGDFGMAAIGRFIDAQCGDFIYQCGCIAII